MFAEEVKRKINLGGASRASSHADVIDQARVQRLQRLEQKRRQENALRLQKWWRGVQEARKVRVALRRIFDGDVTGVAGLRCLVLIGRWDRQAVGVWSHEMVKGGPDLLFAAARSHPDSWLVLTRQVCLLLLRFVTERPLSSEAAEPLQVLNMLLSATNYIGEFGAQVAAEIVHHLVRRDLYPLLSDAIRNIPLEARASDNLSLLALLTTLPFQILDVATPVYAASVTSIFTYILSIPLLPNRLSPQSLTTLSAQTPFANIDLLDMSALINVTSLTDKIHLVANLQVFIPPRYKFLSNPSLSIYFRSLTALLNSIPVQTLNPSTSKDSHGGDSDEDEDEERLPRVTVVSSFVPVTVAPPPPDPKTMKRIASLEAPAHIANLLEHGRSALPSLVPLILALSSIWPNVLALVLISSTGLLRELYRTYVRSSPLGRDGTSLATLVDPSNTERWPPLMVLVDLYTKALMTMGDDEFFGTATAVVAPPTQHTVGGGGEHNAATRVSLSHAVAGKVSAWQNPLTLDELASFSRQLLNIAFVLYLREGATEGSGFAMDDLVGGMTGGIRCTWEGIREKVTRCLVGLHARDSRKPFVPQDHWLITSQINMQSFVEAAIYEDRELSAQSPSAQERNSTLTKRELAYLSPRLGILNNVPFAIPFDVRVAIFRSFILNDVMSRSTVAALPVSGNPFAMLNRLHHESERTRVTVRRGNIAQDGYDKLGDADLKAPVEIAFIDQFGVEEAGIDGGGVFKEFFTSLCKEVFDTDRGLWLVNKKNELYPNPHAYATERHSLNWYRFVGRILGKAMYEGILVDVAFAGFFLAKWLGKQSFLDDLASLDPDLYNGLVFLKHYTGNMEDLALNFTVAIDEFGVMKSIDLIPNGSNVAVSRENRLLYIQLVSHYRLSKQIKLQSEAFFEGLSEIIDRKWIRMFNQQEIQILLGGVNTPIDLNDLKTHTNYGGSYDEQEPTIVAFWKVVYSFDQEQRMKLLRFVTSCSRPPLLGFKELVPNFSIRDAGNDQDRLPTASTCVNLLKLPRFKSEKLLREKLLFAINANAGFDLS